MEENIFKIHFEEKLKEYSVAANTAAIPNKLEVQNILIDFNDIKEKENK